VGATLSRDITLSYGLSSGSVVQVGIGFRSLADHTGEDGEDRSTEFFLGAAFQPVLVRGDRADLNLDLGLEFASVDHYDPAGGSGFLGVSSTADSSPSATILTPRVALLVRFWASSNFSLGAATGIAVDIVNVDGADTRTNFRTAAGNLTQISFTFWFDPK